jgi:hypothetical protein
MQELRWLDLYRVPGVGETLDWVESLDALEQERVEPHAAERTLGALLKARDDIERVRGEPLERLVERSGEAARFGEGSDDAAA